MATKQRYAKLRKRLEEDLASSNASVDDLQQTTEELTRDNAEEGGVPTNHMADEGTNVYEKERMMAFGQELTDRAALIEDALQRMDDGTYGTCRRCGKEIPIERLEAMPFAAYCIDCQEVIDATGDDRLKEQQPLQP